MKSKEAKVCFVIMPISDMDGYEKGHFKRVYNHLIKPACEQAGYEPIRADDVLASNYIVIDILTKIIDSSLVICDLSGRNPNVLYELGVRQAFNLPTVLIKDTKTEKIFDIQGLRYTDYTHEMRVDNVESEINAISKSIVQTVKGAGKEVNSLVQLLGVKPAAVPNSVPLSDETSVLLQAVKDISSRLARMEEGEASRNFRIETPSWLRGKVSNNMVSEGEIHFDNGIGFGIGDNMYYNGTEFVLESIDRNFFTARRTSDNERSVFPLQPSLDFQDIPF